VDQLHVAPGAWLALSFAALACTQQAPSTEPARGRQSLSVATGLGPAFRVKGLSPIQGIDRRLVADFQGDLVLFAHGPMTSAPYDGDGLWRTDGTPAGTRLLRGYLVFSWPDFSRSGFVESNGVLYFAARDYSAFDPSRIYDYELWRSDGTPEGTYLVSDVNSGAGGSFPRELTRVDDHVYFTAENNTSEALWQTDGTYEGTFPIMVLGPPPPWPSYRPRRELTSANGKLFLVRTTSSGKALWKVEECAVWTAACASLVVDRSPDGHPLSVSQLEVVGDALSFRGSWVDAAGTEHVGLWWSDGTAAGTRLVAEVGMPETSDDWRLSKAMGSALYFIAANEGSSTEQLWKSDGTAEGTVLVENVAPLWQREMASIFGGRLAFHVRIPSSGGSYCQTWTSDGTTSGASPLVDVSPPLAMCQELYPPLGLDAEGLLFFQADDGAHGWELWRSDGTSAGTQIVQDFAPGSASGFAWLLGRAGPLVYFLPGDGAELWAVRTDLADRTPPDVTCPADVVAEASGSLTAVAYPAATADDNMSAAPVVSYDMPPGSTFPLGTTMVRATATDDAGNTGSCTFRVTVRDTTPPALTCPAGVSAEATSASGASVAFSPAVASDAVSAAQIAYDHLSGSTFPLGETIVGVTARDAAGNTSTCSFTVEVRDTTPPTIECPAEIVAEATSPRGATLSITSPAGSEAVSTPTVTLVPAGPQFPLGETIVTATALDAAGNLATCRFPVRVRDTTAPALSCPADVTVQTAGDGAEVILETPKATDAVTPEPSVVLDPPSGLFFAAGTTPVRATATDAAGNVARCSFQVTVKLVSPPSPPAGVGPAQGPASTHGGGCSQAGASGVTSLLVFLGLALRGRRRAGR
jgi:ELWxxDGT repeat protein